MVLRPNSRKYGLTFKDHSAHMSKLHTPLPADAASQLAQVSDPELRGQKATVVINSTDPSLAPNILEKDAALLKTRMRDRIALLLLVPRMKQYAIPPAQLP
jgi:hypothetical protein